MDLVRDMFQLQLMLFALIIVGMAAQRTHIITPAGRKSLSALLINIVLPCNIVHSFMSDIDISPAFYHNCVMAIVISIGIQIVATYGSRLLFARYPSEQRSVMTYGMICSNSSFIGLPVAEALYGDLGVLYTSIFQIPIRFNMWTAGLALFTDVDRRSALKRLLRHPCIIAVFVGFALMVLPISLPAVVGDTISSISKCTTPLSMFVIGAILSEADFRTLFSRDTLYFALWRLVLYPLLVLLVLRLLPLDDLLVSVCVIMTGMPAGSTTSILADQYDCDAVFAARIIFVSTLLSIVTIPLLGLLL